MGQNASMPDVERSGASLTSARVKLKRPAEASLLATLHRDNMHMRTRGSLAVRRLVVCERRALTSERDRKSFELRAFAAEARAMHAEVEAADAKAARHAAERQRLKADGRAKARQRLVEAAEQRASAAEARYERLEREVIELRRELALERHRRQQLELGANNLSFNGQPRSLIQFHAQSVRK